MTLEDLLKMQIDGISRVTNKPIKYSPDFRIAVQGERDGGIHIIVHAQDHDSDTLDFIVNGNELTPL